MHQPFLKRCWIALGSALLALVIVGCAVGPEDNEAAFLRDAPAGVPPDGPVSTKSEMTIAPDYPGYTPPAEAADEGAEAVEEVEAEAEAESEPDVEVEPEPAEPTEEPSED